MAGHLSTKNPKKIVMKATNDFVFIIRDPVQAETQGLIIPGQARVKPQSGIIFSAGPRVEDYQIKNGKGKKCLFHKGIGFEIEYEGTTYLVLLGKEIIGIE